MLNLEVLGSSSSGNCYLIKTSDSVLLLECGVHHKTIMKSLNFDLSKVVGCLITHEHGDHSKSVKEIVKSGIDVYSSAGTLSQLGIIGHRLHSIKAKQQFKLGAYVIMPFNVEHDAAEPFGYLIYHPEFGKLLFATDTYYIRYKFQGLNYIMVECNYSNEILNERIKSGSLPKLMKKRLLSSHFSLNNVKKFLSANDLTKVKEILLIHLSDGNSNAAEFKNEIEKLTGIPVRIC